MSNPIFDRVNKRIDDGSFRTVSSVEDLDSLYNAPSATSRQMGRLTVDDVVNRSFILFGLMLTFAAVTWFLLPRSLAALAMVGGVVLTLVLGLVIAFMKSVKPGLIVTFAVFEGLLVGGASRIYSEFYDGAVVTAVVATVCVCAAMFFGWKSGVIKVTSRSRRFFMLALVGYLLFAVVNLVAAWVFNANGGWGLFGFGSGLSIAVSIIAVGLASYSFAVDLDSIDRAVEAQAPEKYSWLLAHGLLVTVVWLYLELLRLFAQLYGRR